MAKQSNLIKLDEFNIQQLPELQNKKQEVDFEEEHNYTATYKNITKTFASLEIVFLISDLPKFENMTIKEILKPTKN